MQTEMKTVQWVDELDPPVKVTYDEINQRLQFTVDRTVLGTGTDSNFNSFTIYGNLQQQIQIILAWYQKMTHLIH